jgi:hypothetical protein
MMDRIHRMSEKQPLSPLEHKVERLCGQITFVGFAGAGITLPHSPRSGSATLRTLSGSGA